MSRLLATIRQIEIGLLVVILAAMIGLAGSQIILRNLFESGISWSDPVLRVLVLWVGMMGAMVATHYDKHIRIDLLSHYISAKWHHHIARLNSLFSSIVCGLLSWHSARFVYYEWQDGTELLSGIPAWLAEAILPIGFGFMALRFAIQIILPHEQEKSS